MRKPQYDESFIPLGSLLEDLEKFHNESQPAWNAYLCDAQNCLVMGDMKGVWKHLKWMSEITTDMRDMILAGEQLLNAPYVRHERKIY